jgi:wyosine [tRNA(Phe)-imidazoG37] synthetase (radical SAM superfamily)
MKLMSAEVKPKNEEVGPLLARTIPRQKIMKTTLNAFGRPPEFLGNRFVYAVISQRSHGLSIGVNLNPDRSCNFDCTYCEVSRDSAPHETTVDLEVLAHELGSLLGLTFEGRLRGLPYFQNVPEELLALKGVALSGEGEPTLSPQFGEIVSEVIHIRSRGKFPFFKLVLITNASGLDLPQVEQTLQLFSSRDEIWAKLDAGTQDYMNVVNHANINLEKVLSNILRVAQIRPVIIQSMFPLLNGQEPSPAEIDAYIENLKNLNAGGAQISLVQVYSAHRPSHHPECGHLPLRSLSRIAQRVRQSSGIPAEVF